MAIFGTLAHNIGHFWGPCWKCSQIDATRLNSSVVPAPGLLSIYGVRKDKDHLPDQMTWLTSEPRLDVKPCEFNMIKIIETQKVRV